MILRVARFLRCRPDWGWGGGFCHHTTPHFTAAAVFLSKVRTPDQGSSHSPKCLDK
jgi:hypothetical protein